MREREREFISLFLLYEASLCRINNPYITITMTVYKFNTTVSNNKIYHRFFIILKALFMTLRHNLKININLLGCNFVINS